MNSGQNEHHLSGGRVAIDVGVNERVDAIVMPSDAVGDDSRGFASKPERLVLLHGRIRINRRELNQIVAITKVADHIAKTAHDKAVVADPTNDAIDAAGCINCVVAAAAIDYVRAAVAGDHIVAGASDRVLEREQLVVADLRTLRTPGRAKFDVGRGSGLGEIERIFTRAAIVAVVVGDWSTRTM